MASFYNLAKQRRSCRKFLNQKVPKPLIDKLLKTTLMAPASKRNNPWHFVVADNPEVIAKLAACKPHGSAFISGAPLAVVVLADPERSDVWIEDTSIASIYLQLTAEDFGLGSCWIQVRKRMHSAAESAENYIRKTLEIPEKYQVESVIALGFKADEKEPFDENKLLTDRVYHNVFGTRYTIS